MSIDPKRIHIQSRRRGLLRWWLVLFAQILGVVVLALVVAWVIGVSS